MNKTTDTALARVKELGRLKKGWYALASELDAVAKSQDWKPGSPQMRLWLAEAGKVSGYTVNMVGRMLSVLDYVRQLEAASSLDGIRLDEVGFSSAEVVKRLDAVDPQLALDSLKELSDGKLKHLALVERYQQALKKNPDAVSSKSSGKAETFAFSRVGIGLLGPWLLGAKRVPQQWRFLDRVPKEAPGNADALGYDPAFPIEETISGYEFVKLDQGINNENQRWDQLLHRTFYVSRFFAEYWLVFHEGTNPDRIGAMRDQINRLEISSVNLLWVLPRREGRTVVFEPFNTGPTEPPLPDWRSKGNWGKILEGFQKP